MTRFVFHILTSLVLLVAMSVAALSTGHARGQAQVAGQIVLCIGTQVITVSVDENGQPTTAHQTCPDAVTKLAAPLLDAPELELTWQVVTLEFAVPATLGVVDTHPVVSRARAPPVLA